MPRAPFVIDPQSPYHLTARSNNRDWYSLPLSVVWTIYSDYLAFLYYAFGVRIHSFVLMNNHFHLVASFPDGNLSASMNYFMRETSRVIGFESRRINHVYGARIFRSCLTSNQAFEHVYKYVYRNPVEAGLCQRVESYRYSSLAGLLGQIALTFPVQEDTLLFGSVNLEHHLEWLNTAPQNDRREAVRLALRQPQFRLPKEKSSRRPHPLERERL